MRESSEVSLEANLRRRPLRRLLGLVISSGFLAALVGGPVATAAATTTSQTMTPAIVRQTDDEGGERPMSPEEMTACLLGVWMHSIEEDSDELLIYRPEEYPFPPARGRTGFEFITAGYLVYYGFGPADEPLVSNGSWELVSRNEVEIEVNQEQGPSLRETLEIASCSEDLLVIAR